MGVRCRVCGQGWRTVGEASDEGAVPSFWIGQVEVDAPACGRCVAEYLELDGVGDFCALSSKVEELVRRVGARGAVAPEVVKAARREGRRLNAHHVRLRPA